MSDEKDSQDCPFQNDDSFKGRFYDILKKVLTKINKIYLGKDTEISIKNREDGNRLFLTLDHTPQVHMIIYNLYTRSIAFAHDQSEEQALAYSNRAALLFHVKKYQESIIDCDIALGITKSDILKVKVYCRKVDCLTALKLNENKAPFEAAVECYESVPDDHEEKHNLVRIITRTKMVLDREALKILPKYDDSEIKATEILNEKEKISGFDNIDVRHSNKYGKHLIASQNLKAGDIIYIEEPYALSTNLKDPYFNCSHCLTVTWCSVPCKYCSWCVFCCEKCREEAWEKYHEFECSIVTFLKKLESVKISNEFVVALRIVITGIKKFGSIKKLKAEIENINSCKEDHINYFSMLLADQSFENKFKCISMLTDNHHEKCINPYSITVAIVVICIAKYTSVLNEESLKNVTLTNLAENEDMVCLKNVLIKFIKVVQLNKIDIRNVNLTCIHAVEYPRCLDKECISKGVCIGPITGLINNSCIPNAKRCFGKNGKILIFALEPIDKNSQIFVSYLCGFYDTPGNINRNAMLQERYNFNCNCTPCKNNWPPILKKKFELKPVNAIEEQIISKYKDLIELCIKDNIKFSEATVQNISNAIDKATESLPQPCTVRNVLTFCLEKVFEKIYGYNIFISSKKCKN